MEDVELARLVLEEEGVSLAIVKEGQLLLSSRERGVRPLYHAVLSLRDSLHNASLADCVVGLPVAMLCVHGEVASVYARVASVPALAMLAGGGVRATSQKAVPYIRNREGTGRCPFESLAEASGNPGALLTALGSLFGGANP
jgi:hypothetical protein